MDTIFSFIKGIYKQNSNMGYYSLELKRKYDDEHESNLNKTTFNIKLCNDIYLVVLDICSLNESTYDDIDNIIELKFDNYYDAIKTYKRLLNLFID